jgi:hypothetical protein
MHKFGLVLLFLSGAVVAADAPSGKSRAPTMAEVLAATVPSDWRGLDPANTLYLQLPGGRVVIELAPAFAPLHTSNIRTLVREKYYDGLAVVRSQDNFVVQWGDADKIRPTEAAGRKLPDETVLAWDRSARVERRGELAELDLGPEDWEEDLGRGLAVRSAVVPLVVVQESEQHFADAHAVLNSARLG